MYGIRIMKNKRKTTRKIVRCEDSSPMYQEVRRMLLNGYRISSRGNKIYIEK